MELTSVYWEGIAEFSSNRGYKVSVVNLASTKSYGKSLLIRNKTDSVDARLIADFCREQNPEPWVAPLPGERKLWALMRMRTQEINRQAVAPHETMQSIELMLKTLNWEIARL